MTAHGKAIASALLLSVAGCSGGTDEADGPGGKADDFSVANELRISGDREATLQLDDAVQCEAQQFAFLGSWHNPSDPGFELPVFRVALAFSGGVVPEPGDTLEASSGGSRVAFDGIGYSSEGAGGCAVTVTNLGNEGSGGDFGIALSFAGCQLATDDGRSIVLDGTVGCRGAGFDLLFEPEDGDMDPDPDPEAMQTCSDDDYIAWMNDVLAALDASGSSIDDADTARIDAAFAQKPCEGFNDAPFQAWVTELEQRLGQAGATLDPDDRARLDVVLALRPDARSEAAYVAWFDVYENVFRDVAPSSSAQIDGDEAALLDVVHAGRVQTAGDAAFAAWSALALSYFQQIAPSSSAVIDAGEQALITELLRSKVRAGGAEAYRGWQALYDGYLDGALVGSSSTIDSGEAALLGAAATLRPEGGSDGAFAAWAEGFGDLLERMGTADSAGARAGFDLYLGVKPCAGDPAAAAVTAALADLRALLDDADPRLPFVEAAAPSACQD